MNDFHPIWSPTAEQIERANLTRFAHVVASRYGVISDSYEMLHRWSLEQRGAFWTELWRFASVAGDLGEAATDPTRAYVPGRHMTETTWFPGGELNFAENLLRAEDCREPEFAESPAVFFRSETGEESRLSRRELLHQATAFARFLQSRGVVSGDRVAAVIPNIPEAIVAMLGTTAIGAIWSSCSPDFGADAICDRFAQIEPKVLVTSAKCSYAGKPVDPFGKTATILDRLPSVRSLVVSGDDFNLPNHAGVETVRWESIIAMPSEEWKFERFPFGHPAFIMYSSGTTGAPKCIVHGAGGTLLQHLKEHILHTDVHTGDRVFYFTTTGWMMWNWLVGALAAKAAVVLFDGSPFHPNPATLFQLAQDVGVTQFGAGAKYYSALEKNNVDPAASFRLDSLRCVLSTGSPLLPESFDYIYKKISPNVCLASISGGTDIISCFVLGCPTRPVSRGEIQVKGLGMDVQIFGAEGRPVKGETGELVCVSPFPSMPVFFWNDADKKKYLGSYFTTYDNVWCHGDFAEETETGLVIYGRSDTTLNPGGVRIGTAEIYRQVETFTEIAECLATALRREGDEQIVLFVRMQPDHVLTEDLVKRIKQRLREHCSPRHVPSFMVAVPDLPRTISGKISEIAVRNIINAIPVKNAAALANPDSLEFYKTLNWPR